MILRFHLYMWTCIILASLLMYIGERDWVFTLLLLGWIIFGWIPNEPVETE